MKMQAKATFVVKSWDEKPYQELVGGGKLTRASVAYTYDGDIVGESTVEYVMFYRADGTGNFVGVERIVGRIGERAGSFVLQHTGTFVGHGVQANLVVMPNSGTEGLLGLRGESQAAIQGQGPFPIALEYDFI